MGLGRNKRTDGVVLRMLRVKEGLFLGENKRRETTKLLLPLLLPPLLKSPFNEDKDSLPS